MKLPDLVRFGLQLLPHSYASARTAREAGGNLDAWLAKAGVNGPPPQLRRILTASMGDVCRALWAASWAKNGFPQVVLAHKLAASLMATKMSDEILEQVVSPWPAYAIRVPDQLLFFPALDGTDERLQVDLVGVIHESAFVSVNLMSFAQSGFVGVQVTSFRDHLDGGDTMDWGTNHATDAHLRMIDLAVRLVLGVELEMSDPSRVRRTTQPSGKDPATGLPKPWTFTLTRTSTVDCREEVRAFSLGLRREAPSLQTLVRGHWKRQPHGPDRLSRKWIHIEPYWRGPEDAPVPMRTIRLPG